MTLDQLRSESEDRYIFGHTNGYTHSQLVEIINDLRSDTKFRKRDPDAILSSELRTEIDMLTHQHLVQVLRDLRAGQQPTEYSAVAAHHHNHV